MTERDISGNLGGVRSVSDFAGQDPYEVIDLSIATTANERTGSILTQSTERSERHAVGGAALALFLTGEGNVTLEEAVRRLSERE